MYTNLLVMAERKIKKKETQRCRETEGKKTVKVKERKERTKGLGKS